jgi:phosphonate transport system substrate-binding protein
MFPSFYNRKAFKIMELLGCILLVGCFGEPEATYVDFSQRMTVERPDESYLEGSRFKVAVGSMISAKETAVHYHQLLKYIAGNLGREIQLVQRKTYREINELIGRGQIDLAFICSGPYVSGKDRYRFKAMAMPEVRGSYLYHSYLIVNKDSPFQKLEDLKGKSFAFTDPESNTGKLVPTYWLRQKGETPETFFEKTTYTYSHDNSIMAVALCLVDGATVHGQIWEYYHRKNPQYTSKTRIIKKSVPFGNPPVVTPTHLPAQTKARIRQLLYNMHRDPAGKQILDELMIDRFIAPREDCYHPILAMRLDAKP